jgi:hypothetical protein
VGREGGDIELLSGCWGVQMQVLGVFRTMTLLAGGEAE